MLVIELLQTGQSVFAFQASPPQMISIRFERQLNSANIGQIFIHCLFAANSFVLVNGKIRIAARHTVDLLLKRLPRTALPPIVLTVLIGPASFVVKAVGELNAPRFPVVDMQKKEMRSDFCVEKRINANKLTHLMTDNKTERSKVHVGRVLFTENVSGQYSKRQSDGVSVSTKERVYG